MQRLGYAEIDLVLCIEPTRLHDVVAEYNRFDGAAGPAAALGVKSGAPEV
jgi:hypothetical protein